MLEPQQLRRGAKRAREVPSGQVAELQRPESQRGTADPQGVTTVQFDIACTGAAYLLYKCVNGSKLNLLDALNSRHAADSLETKDPQGHKGRISSG